MTVNGSTVILTWAASAAGPTVTKYIIESGSSPGGYNLGIVATNGPTPSLVAPGVPAGTYYVQVRAASASGWGPPSHGIVVIVGGGGPGGGPGAPVNLAATAVGGDVALRWNAAPGTSPPAYIIEVGSVPGASNLANFSTGSNATEFHASGIGADVYYVRVRAVTAAGPSGASNEATLVVDDEHVASCSKGLAITSTTVKDLCG